MLPEVPDGWTSTSLGHFVESFSKLNDVGDLAPLSVTKDRGIVLQSEKFNKRIATKDSQKYKILNRGEFSYDPMSLYYGALGRLDCCDVGIVSPAYITFRLKSGLDADFFRYLTRTKTFNRDVNRVTTGGNQDGKRKKTDWSAFCSLPLVLPPLREQRRIAEILSSVDESIQATQAVIEQTRTVKQGVLRRLLIKGIGHSQFKQTEIGEIPQGWAIKKLGEVAEFINGRGFKPHEWGSEGLPIIRIQNLNGGKDFNYYSGHYAPKLVVRPGNLLFAWSGSRGTSFGPHIWNGDTGLLNYHTWRVEPKEATNISYLFYALLLLTEKIEGDSHGASALVHMQKRAVVDYAIPLPPPSERDDIVKRLRAFDLVIADLNQEKVRQIEMKSALMSALLTGRVRVAEDLPMAAE